MEPMGRTSRGGGSGFGPVQHRGEPSERKRGGLRLRSKDFSTLSVLGAFLGILSQIIATFY